MNASTTPISELRTLLRIFLTLAITLTFLTLSAQSRKRRTSIPPRPRISVAEAMERYDFTEAARQLRTQIATASAAQQDSLQQLLRCADRAAELLPHTERVIFIDSVVVDKDALLRTLQLSPDAGRMLPARDLFRATEGNRLQLGIAAYVNPLNSAAYFSAANASGRLVPQSAYRSGDRWCTPAPVSGIDSTFVTPDFPFVRTDGITFYFAAQGENGIGGYDLFATRYNPETRSYLRPTPIGMPFNSPANDYLYVIDEAAGVGYFATDRRQPKGKVCLYTFLPSIERVTFETDTIAPSVLVNAARISAIAPSQEGHTAAIAAARLRRNKMLAAVRSSSPTHFRFVVNDALVYTRSEDFHNPEARRMIRQWVEEEQQLAELATRHRTAQQQYAELPTDHLRRELHNLETALRTLTHTHRSLEKSIRRAELSP